MACRSIPVLLGRLLRVDVGLTARPITICTTQGNRYKKLWKTKVMGHLATLVGLSEVEVAGHLWRLAGIGPTSTIEISIAMVHQNCLWQPPLSQQLPRFQTQFLGNSLWNGLGYHCYSCFARCEAWVLPLFCCQRQHIHTKGGRQEWPNVGSSHRRDKMNCERPKKEDVRGVVYCAVGFLGNSEVVFIRVVDKYIYIYRYIFVCTYMIIHVMNVFCI